MNTEVLLNESKDGANYFYHFNFSKFKKIVYPLAIAVLLFIIRQFITNTFYIPRSGGMGLADLLNSVRFPKELPLWAETLNKFIDILILLVVLCWEAVYEKKYDKIKFVVLLCLPSIVLNVLYLFPSFLKSQDSDSFFSIYFLISFFPTYALYGALRGKILYGKKLSLMGYLIGLFVVVNINPIYQKIGSILLVNDFLNSIYSYGSAIINIFTPLSFFYFIFLSDSGLLPKSFTKMPSNILLTSRQFTLHFTILFTSLLALHLNFTENFSQHWFGDMNSRFSIILYSFFEFVRIIFQIAFVYLLFSQLLLLQLTKLRRRPLWIYLSSFIPVINLIPLLFFFPKSKPLSDSEYFEMEDNELRNRSLLQFCILFIASIYGIYKFMGLGFSREDLIYSILAIVTLYILILYFRIGIWIALLLLSIAAKFFLFQDIPSTLYYTCVLFYGAIGLYNIHIAIFWTAQEWDEIEENTVVENIQEA